MAQATQANEALKRKGSLLHEMCDTQLHPPLQAAGHSSLGRKALGIYVLAPRPDTQLLGLADR
jgi:hypothetical protein